MTYTVRDLGNARVADGFFCFGVDMEHKILEVVSDEIHILEGSTEDIHIPIYLGDELHDLGRQGYRVVSHSVTTLNSGGIERLFYSVIMGRETAKGKTA